MKPAILVVSLTRDRFNYSKHCFQTLEENAGCSYTHFVFDNGSTDGTQEWLFNTYTKRKGRIYSFSSDNIGIHRAMNRVLDAFSPDFDLVVKIDNDLELLTPGTLKAVAEHVLEDPEQPRIVSPLILGLRNRPGIYATRETPQGRIGLTRALGGVFMPIPPLFVKEGFRYDESAPVWGGDDERLSAMAHEHGGYTGYLIGFEANHYRTTLGQAEEQKEYLARRVREGGPAL